MLPRLKGDAYADGTEAEKIQNRMPINTPLPQLAEPLVCSS